MMMNAKSLLLKALAPDKNAPFSKKEMLFILKKALDLFQSEPTIIHMDYLHARFEQLVVCGDTHGQLYDVLRLFELYGQPSDSKPFIFNGDFVDRGIFGTELLALLLLYKINFPQYVFLNRGNHESRSMTGIYGFEGECLFKYDQDVLNLVYSVFDALPLGVVVNKRVLVIHGGLFSDESVSIDTLRDIDRFHEPPSHGAFHDILWSDPDEQNGRHLNRARGGGLKFGPDVTEKFLNDNMLDMIIRSHEVRPAGYSIEHSGRLVTVFSAPNYMDAVGNKAAVVSLKATTSEGPLSTEFFQWDAVPHPTIDEVRARYMNNKSKL